MNLTTRLDVSFAPYRLIFKEPAGTSRGIMYDKVTFFIRLRDKEDRLQAGYGEVPVFSGLSEETVADVEESLCRLCNCVSTAELYEALSDLPSSVIFGVQQALKSFENRHSGLIFPSSFTDGLSSININGLVWMGSFDIMKDRIDRKLQYGFSCIKLKIGAINWDEEIALIKYIREKGGSNISIRVDANGAFTPEDCLWRLEKLSEFDVHSIEQPIRKGNWKALRSICASSPVPIALDEELIGLPPGEKRDYLLDFVNPQFIILKPALCYGFSGAEDWIKRAGMRGIGWWITSALESSVGLNAIAQFIGSMDVSLPQGLGTGMLYVNNFNSPLKLEKDIISFRGPSEIYKTQLETLDWR